MSPIGVDEWVAQHTDRQDAGTGWRRWMYTAEARVGWWPRLAIFFVLGLLFMQLSLNANIQQVAINCLIYAILAVGLNIAVGWAGLLDLGYVAFFGTGAYAFAVLSSGNNHWSSIVSIPVIFLGTGVFGAVIGLVSLRVSGDYLAIVTLFVGQAFVEVTNNVATGPWAASTGSSGSIRSTPSAIRSPRRRATSTSRWSCSLCSWAYCTSSTSHVRAAAGAPCARTSSPPRR